MMKLLPLKNPLSAYIVAMLAGILCPSYGALLAKDAVSAEIAARLDHAPIANSKNFDERSWSNSPNPELTKVVLAAALEMRSKALAGDSDAQRHLSAGFLNSGRNEEYLEWVNRAANSGNIAALMDLGIAYSNGMHVKKTPQKGLQLFLAAAEKGDCEAQEMVAMVFENDDGLPPDELESTKWWAKASANGSPEAQWRLAEVYLRGGALDGSPLPGFEKDVARAIALLKSACEGDCEFAQHQLGAMYLKGERGVPVDTRTAISLLRQAAEHGDSNSQYLLGQVYATGAEGVLKDYGEAYGWLNIAQASPRLMSTNGTKAAALLDTIEAKMTAAQIEQAQKRSNGFKVRPTKRARAFSERLNSGASRFEALVETVAAVGPAAVTEAEFLRDHNSK